ncbi:MAG TPA: ankyrin repeat domain-containing protein [Rickettsia endosymbiont of Pyrocoelia pectoralis]|nr:ankyrin repeat domain-containing protein [Rickettsia endosymbiont of Pyrocoelia pectoralis]
MPLSDNKKFYIAETEDEKALCNAVRNNDLKEAKSLILKLIDSNQFQKFNGDLRDCDPDETYYAIYYPLLSVAVLKHNFKMFEMLLASGFKPHAVSSGLNPASTPLIEASKCGQFDMVRKIASILKKEELNYYDKDIRNSAVYYAIKNNHVNIFSVLNIHQVDIDFEIAMGFAVISGNFNLFIQFFYDAPQNITNKILNEGYLLQCAASKKNLQIVKFLLEQDNVQINIEPVTANSNGIPIYHYSPLSIAASVGSIEIIEALLNKGADVNFGSPPPFIAAVKNGHLKICYLLKALRANTKINLPHGEKSLELYKNYLDKFYDELDEFKKLIKNKIGVYCAYDKNKPLNIKDLEIWYAKLVRWDPKICSRKAYTMKEIEELSEYEQNLFPEITDTDVNIIG